MIYHSEKMQEDIIVQAAEQMCAAARTAPKAHGKDFIKTLVLTGEDKEALAVKMEEIGRRDLGEQDGWFDRDARNVRASQAVVLIGVKKSYRAVKNCGYCGFKDCADCSKAGGNCAFMYVDQGIAIGSAVRTAAHLCVDNRIMLSVGKAAMEMPYGEEDVLWHGIPISVTGKNHFFSSKR